MQPQGPNPNPEQEKDPPPDILEAFRQVSEGGKASFAATFASTRALRSLLLADLALARSALGHGLAFTAVAVVLGAVGGLLLMAALVTVLATKIGLSWWFSLLLVGLLCFSATVFSAWRAMRYFEHTGLQATRRQLAKIGIGEREASPATAADGGDTPA